MATARFFVDALAASGTITIEGPEAKHINGVLRMDVGDQVIVFDGCGGEAICQIASTSKKSVALEIVQRIDTDRELSTQIHLAVALPKGDRQRTLVEGLVQLGTTSLTPLATTRGVAQPNSGALQRLERYVVEASKQSGRNTLMQIRPPLDVHALADTFPESRRLVAHPYGAPKRLADAVSTTAQNNSGTTFCIAIGPEGGFTDGEIEILAQAQWQPISLGRRILRVEMAAIMVVGAISALTETS
ncbi:MAG: RsmE family RNA methyltransferase [Aureliella sp.]